MTLPAQKEYVGHTSTGSAFPSRWPLKMLKRVFMIVGGSTPDSTDPRYWDGDIPWATPADLGNSTDFCLTHTQRRITGVGVESCGTTLVPAGSIVLSIRAPIGSVGVAAVPLCTNQGCKSLVPTDGINSQYYAYCLSASIEALTARGRGTTFLELSADELGRFCVPAPPTDEQSAIASFLDRHTSKIDTLIAKQERLIDLLVEKRKAVISHAVTKGTAPDARMRSSGVAWLGEVPCHWDITKARRLFRAAKRQGYPQATVLSIYRDYGVVVKSSRDDNLNRTPDNLEVYQLVEVGDLVINKMKAWQGSLGISPHAGITSPDYIVFSPQHQENPRFLHYVLRSQPLAKVYLAMSNGIRPSQWRLDPEQFAQLPLALPPRSEQDRIVEFIERNEMQMDSLSAKVASSIQLMREHRAALITAAVTGKIDVRDSVEDVA